MRSNAEHLMEGLRAPEAYLATFCSAGQIFCSRAFEARSSDTTEEQQELDRCCGRDRTVRKTPPTTGEGNRQIPTALAMGHFVAYALASLASPSFPCLSWLRHLVDEWFRSFFFCPTPSRQREKKREKGGYHISHFLPRTYLVRRYLVNAARLGPLGHGGPSQVFG